MTAIFANRFRVRAYECDSLGHVNNSVYVQYLLQTTLDAIGVINSEGASPEARRLEIEYRTPARYGDELDIATWVMGRNDAGFVRGYTITRAADGAPVVGAELEWTNGGRLRQVGSSFERVEMPPPLKTFTPPRDNGALPFHWRQTVRRYELDSTARVGVAVYFNWLEEVTFRAAELDGWSVERMRANDFITLQYRHDAELFAGAREGDEIEIVSRLIEVRRVRCTWLHEIRRAGASGLLGTRLFDRGIPRLERQTTRCAGRDDGGADAR